MELLKVEWIYENFDSKDVYAVDLLGKYFDFNSISQECIGALQWRDFSKDLQFFKFVLSQTPEANKQNSTVRLTFDISKLPLTTYLELDMLFDMLLTLKRRNPIEFMKYPLESESSSEKDPFISSIFDSVRKINGSILINKKNRILISIFDYIDPSIYKESLTLSLDLLEEVVKKDLDFDKLSVSTPNQLALILPKVKDRDSFIIKSVKKQMCIFQLISLINLSEDFIAKNKGIFSEIAQESMRMHFIVHSCRDEVDEKAIELIFKLLTGRNKIIAAAILKKQLDCSQFKLLEIDESMEYSVNVFPLSFFQNNSFKSSAVHLLRKYPSLISNDKLNKLINSFEKTTPDQVATLITDRQVLSKYLHTLPINTIKRLNEKNSNPKMKIVYLFYLREAIEQFDVEYSIVLEELFEPSFLKYLLYTNNNVGNFVDNCVEHIANMTFQNTAFYCGFNFDSDPQFYYNLNSIPVRNEVMCVLLNVLQPTSTTNIHLEILTNLIQILLYRPCTISDHLIDKLKDQSFLNEVTSVFNLKSNGFILERFLMQARNEDLPMVELGTLKINKNKAIDVILRNVYVAP